MVRGGHYGWREGEERRERERRETEKKRVGGRERELCSFHVPLPCINSKRVCLSLV